MCTFRMYFYNLSELMKVYFVYIILITKRKQNDYSIYNKSIPEQISHINNILDNCIIEFLYEN